MTIQSHRGPYGVVFDDAVVPAKDRCHYIVDAKVANLHGAWLANVLASSSVIQIEATEEAKKFGHIEGYIESLIANDVRRSDTLVAIGGGIVQDITCFVATVLLRGVSWRFYPTTLLAQADSCIGSKSSINFGVKKNLIGTFFPPTDVTIAGHVLSTLQQVDVRSGIGEMLKVHAIDGPAKFDAIAADYDRLSRDQSRLHHWLHSSLSIKQGFIEEDEFDRARRNLLNYGHSFGHAIEAATEFAIPHGIAVTLGMDVANYVSMKLGRTTPEHFKRMHGALAANYVGFERFEIPLRRFFDALAKDKKNTSTKLRLILPNEAAQMEIVSCEADATFRQHCASYFEDGRRT